MVAPSPVREVAAQAEPWLRRLARLGYASKGVIYGLIGLLALVAATGSGRPTNQAGAINTLAGQPFGHALLLLVGVTLLAYALWRIAEAAFNPEDKAPFKRIGYLISAAAYGGFGWAAIAVAAMGDKAHSNPQAAIRRVLDLPLGQAVAIVVALIFAGVAIGQIYNGWRLLFFQCLDRKEMSPEQLAVAKWTGRIGIMSRGILFGLIAWTLLKASLDRNPKEAGGIDHALRLIEHVPFGRFLLAVVAVGLVSYGVFMCVEARFRRMTPILDEC